MEKLILQFKTPKKIYSDDGIEFVNEIWVKITKLLNIQWSTIKGYNSQWSEFVEI